MTTPQVYVGTYAKYNNGSIAGAWVELEGLTKETFQDAIKALHADESDPEFMFQDYEGFPEHFYGESHLADELWDWLELTDDDRNVLAAYQSCINPKGTMEEAEEAFWGYHETPTDLAHEWVESTGMFDNIPDNITSYFDYERFGRDLAMDFSESEGYYFHNH